MSRVLGLLLLAMLGAYAAHAAIGFGGHDGSVFFSDWVHGGLMVAAAALCTARAIRKPAERAAWWCFAVALATYAAGEITWNAAYADMKTPPYPSAADAMWIVFYPTSYVGLVLLVRSRVRRFHTSLWLDGLIGGLTVAAVGAPFVYEPLLHTAGENGAALATTLAYPLGDMLLLSFVVGAFALTGWRPGRGWLLLGGALALNAVADTIYNLRSADGTWVDGSLPDVLFPAAVLLLALAAWQRPVKRRQLRLEGMRLLVMPGFFALAAVGLAGYGQLNDTPNLGVWLDVGALAALMARTFLTFRENVRLLVHSEHESLTDALTGMDNRRALMNDLPEAVEAATVTDPHCLTLFDLDGFKRYNDTFGHSAGDALLARLGKRLAAVTKPFGNAYRLGGDEFCLLVDRGATTLNQVLAAAESALTEHGEGFSVTTSYGTVRIPMEAATAEEALLLADQRMYAHKEGRSGLAARQARDVLLGILRERQPDLYDHLHGVSACAARVAQRIGMQSEQVDEVIRAAELHDIGKMAIPDAILDKPGPLDDDEWAFIRRHTIMGERILAEAPALRPVAKLVRSSHERWDGGGYPDGLAGEEIPLGARIVSVCDAFDAMTSPRPYDASRPRDAALAELRRCSGAHFDPAVVEAFCIELSMADDVAASRAHAGMERAREAVAERAERSERSERTKPETAV